MKLDKRIKALTDIQSVTNGCHDWEFMNKKGYFADSILEFENLKNCSYGEYKEYREHDKCFGYAVVGNLVDFYKSYFIPEDVLNPVEKKYRPYSLEEFCKNFSIGAVLDITRKGSDIDDHLMFVGYENESDLSGLDIPGEGYIMLGMNRYTLAYLFEYYEMVFGDERQPFGVEE